MPRGGYDTGGRDLTRIPLPLLVAAPALASVAMAVWILWGARAPCSASARFISSPEFVLWLLILCGQAAMWALASGFVWMTVSKWMRELWRSGDLTSRQLGGLAVALLILVLLAVGSVAADNVFDLGQLRELPTRDEFPLEHHSPKVRVIVVIGGVIGFTAICGDLGGGHAAQPPAP